MFIFGLTGPSGAGKGTIAELFAKYKVYSVDTDAVYHRLLIPPSACLDELTARFGTGVLSPDGSLNRQALAAEVMVVELLEPRRDQQLPHLLQIPGPEIRLLAVKDIDILHLLRLQVGLQTGKTLMFRHVRLLHEW